MVGQPQWKPPNPKEDAMVRRRNTRRWGRWAVAAVALAITLAVALPYIYIQSSRAILPIAWPW
jgi:hypothetical protein